jgi:fumarate reductase flavoprotein subunit
MKNIIFALSLTVFSCVSLGGRNVASEESAVFYEGAAQGYRGPIQVQVRVSGGSITEIIIIDSEEDYFVGGAAIEELIDMVIQYNTTDIDAVTGATESSRGFLKAVENAIMNL